MPGRQQPGDALATDGDFNVGPSSDGDDGTHVSDRREAGRVRCTFLSVLGFGTGNLKDSKMETGRRPRERQLRLHRRCAARRAKQLVDQKWAARSLTVAKDVKIQVEFNPEPPWPAIASSGTRTGCWRTSDFNDDTKDAGEIGAGHTVTALYEIVPAGGSVPGGVDANPFRKRAAQGGERWTLPAARALQAAGRRRLEAAGAHRARRGQVLRPRRPRLPVRGGGGRVRAAPAQRSARRRHHVGRRSRDRRRGGRRRSQPARVPGAVAGKRRSYSARGHRARASARADPSRSSGCP